MQRDFYKIAFASIFASAPPAIGLFSGTDSMEIENILHRVLKKNPLESSTREKKYVLIIGPIIKRCNDGKWNNGSQESIGVKPLTLLLY